MEDNTCYDEHNPIIIMEIILLQWNKQQMVHEAL